MISYDPAHRQTAYLTDVGQVRSENQDACSEFCDPGTGTQLLVVADGMGGHQGGATASRMAIETVGEIFQRAQLRGPEMLVEALSSANGRIFDAATQHSELRGMGTTCVALLINRDGSSWVAHVGDSRAYQFRNGDLHQITADHSAVAELERRGMITAAEAEVHPRRNELLRSIGVEPDVEVDVNPVEIADGDQFLLCSDGLSGVVHDNEIAQVLVQRPPAESVRVLVDSANARGGPDNVTVMVTSFAQHSPRAAPAPGRTNAARGSGDGPGRLRLVTALAVLTAALLVAGLIVWLATRPEFSEELRGNTTAEERSGDRRDASTDRWNEDRMAPARGAAADPWNDGSDDRPAADRFEEPNDGRGEDPFPDSKDRSGDDGHSE
jgi:serine/threonine protein phosphatase PrpC